MFIASGTVVGCDALLRALHTLDANRSIPMKKFFKNKSGATAIEYGLIAALIAVAIITAVTTLGTNLGTTFNNLAGNVGGSVGTNTGGGGGGGGGGDTTT